MLGWQSASVPSQLLSGGKLISSHKKVADTQNNFYIKKVDDINTSLADNGADPLTILKTALERRDKTNDRGNPLNFKEISVGKTSVLIVETS